MNTDIYGNELKVGDEVVVFYELVNGDNDKKYRAGTLVFIDEHKKTARVKYTDIRYPLSVGKECVVLASDPRVSMLVLQL